MSKKIRYFLVSYVYSKGSGNIYFDMNKFPPNGWIKQKAIEVNKIQEEVIVTNIFEFKDEEDYNDFRQNE